MPHQRCDYSNLSELEKTGFELDKPVVDIYGMCNNDYYAEDWDINKDIRDEAQALRLKLTHRLCG